MECFLKIIIAIIITAIAIKDFIFISDVYILRGLSQGLCLLVGSILLIGSMNSKLIKKYYIIYMYILTILISGVLSNHSEYVIFQILSLLSVVVFFASYYEWNDTSVIVINKTVTIILSATILISLLLALIEPKMVFSTFYEGDSVGNVSRFHGIYPKSAMIAISSSLLFGQGVFKVRNKWIKILLVVSSCLCLFLTGSRTFWIATVFAAFITAWFYIKKWRIHSLVISTAILLTVLLYSLYLGSINIFASKNNAMRSESIINLSGRTVIWKKSIDGFKVKPLLGYGFTVGAESLIEGKKISVFSSKTLNDRQFGRSTLHNGYIQALLDSGVIGFVLYITIILVSFVRIIKYDGLKKYPEVMFAIVFYSISNIGESIIGSTATFGGFFFWVNSIAALSLYKTDKLASDEMKFDIIS